MIQCLAMSAPSPDPVEPLDPAGAEMFVEFEGGRDANAPLTWGQRAIWKSVLEFADHSWLNFRRVLAVPRRADADVPSVARAIGALMARHESLRTRIRPVGGELCQVAARSGRLPVTVVHGRTGEPIAEALRDRLGAVPYDYTREWPLRVALVVVDGRVSHVVVVISHAAADFHACEILLRDLRLLLLRGSVPSPPGPQSVEIARRESGEGRRRSERAVEHWREEYRRLPRSMFDPAGPALAPRYRRALLESAAIEVAARRIAARHRVSTSTVLLAATATLIAGWTGHDVCGVFTMSNNRFPAGYADAISKLNQLGLFVLDLSDRPCFADIVPRTWESALRAYQHAYYDPTAMDAAMRELGRPYGSGLEPWCYFNDLRLPDNTAQAGPALDEPAVRARLTKSRLTWPESLDRFAWRFRLQVMDAPGATGLSLTADTCYLPPPDVEGFLFGLEELVVAGAFGDLLWPWSLRRAARIQPQRTGVGDTGVGDPAGLTGSASQVA